jgi:hypothetical protein
VSRVESIQVCGSLCIVVIGHEPHEYDTTTNPAANPIRSLCDALRERQNDSRDERGEHAEAGGARPKISDVTVRYI